MAKKITFKIIVPAPDTRLPSEYVKLSPNPRETCNKTLENIAATTLVAKNICTDYR